MDKYLYLSEWWKLPLNIFDTLFNMMNPNFLPLFQYKLCPFFFLINLFLKLKMIFKKCMAERGANGDEKSKLKWMIYTYTCLKHSYIFLLQLTGKKYHFFNFISNLKVCASYLLILFFQTNFMNIIFISVPKQNSNI